MIALVALYRPGPMQYIPSYAAQKNGRKEITYVDERLKPITATRPESPSTRSGTSRSPRSSPGFTPAEAETLRRAIGRKVHESWRPSRASSSTGARRTASRPGSPTSCGRTSVLAGLLLRQGEFGLLPADRVPHRLAQGEPALRVHRGADLEHHEHEGPSPVYVDACDEIGIEVLPPDVNSSAVDFAVVEGKIRFGLNAVKNVGETAAQRIVAAHSDGGPFTSISDFTERVDPQVVNRRSLESLVKCGTLDSTRATRMGMLGGSSRQALAHGQKLAADRFIGQASIFDLGGVGVARDAVEPSRPSLPAEFEKQELLRLEKETLGLYVSERPLSGVRDQLRRKPTPPSASSSAGATARSSPSAGSSPTSSTLTTKGARPMVFLTLDDPTGSAEVIVFDSAYQAARELCVTDRILDRQGTNRPQAAGRDQGDRLRGQRPSRPSGAPRGPLRTRSHRLRPA